MYDLNDAQPQMLPTGDPIPDGTFAKIRMTIRAGGVDGSVPMDKGLLKASAILTSRKAEARRFKRWVTHEVLPALRRRGVYDMRAVEPIDQLAPYLHDHQLRVLHALEAATDDTGVTVGRLPMITGLSIEKDGSP